MTTASVDALDADLLQTLLGPHLTAEQAMLIFQQGQDAVVFALLSLAKRLAEKSVDAATGVDPSAPSGQTPPYAKPTAKARKKAKGATPGHPGRRRPTPERFESALLHADETGWRVDGKTHWLWCFTSKDVTYPAGGDSKGRMRGKTSKPGVGRSSRRRLPKALGHISVPCHGRGCARQCRDRPQRPGDACGPPRDPV